MCGEYSMRRFVGLTETPRFWLYSPRQWLAKFDRRDFTVWDPSSWNVKPTMAQVVARGKRAHRYLKDRILVPAEYPEMMRIMIPRLDQITDRDKNCYSFIHRCNVHPDHRSKNHISGGSSSQVPPSKFRGFRLQQRVRCGSPCSDICRGL